MSDSFIYINQKISTIPAGMCMNFELKDFREAANAFTSSAIFDSVRGSDISNLEEWLKGFHNIDVVLVRGLNPYRDFYKVCKEANQSMEQTCNGG